MKYQVYDSYYKRKSDVHTEASKILNKYRLNYEIKAPNRDFYWLSDLLSKHREFKEKIGVGIYSFRIQREPRYNGRGFYVVRTDGTTVDFSYKMCFPPKRTRSKEHIQDVCSALRTCVDNYVYEYKLERLKNKTFYSDISNLKENNLEVDHVYPLTFVQIVKNWIKEENLDIYSLKTVGNTFKELADTQLRDSFYNYHKKVAKLRLLTKYENLIQPKVILQETDFLFN